MKHIPVILLVLLTVIAHAQSIRLVSAAQQQWFGGIARARGNKYTFVVAVNKQHKRLKFTSIWVDDKQIELVVGHGNVAISKEYKDGYEAVINLSTSSARIPGRKPVVQRPPVAYKGVALLGYTVDGKERYFVIKKVTEKLPPLNYP